MALTSVLLAALALGFAAAREPGAGASVAGLGSIDAAAEHRFSAAAQPPVECPADVVPTGSTVVMVAARDDLSPDEEALLRFMNTMPGGVQQFKVGVHGRKPLMQGVHTVVYFDVETDLVDRVTDSVTQVSRESCNATAAAIGSWFFAVPGRAVIVHGLALSAFRRGALTRSGTRQMESMWRYLNGLPAGGIVLLAHNETSQACMRTVVAALQLSPLHGNESAAPLGAPADAHSPVLMCPQPALFASQQYWDVFGRPAHYALPAWRGGTVVPVGPQLGGLTLRAIAYWDGDFTRPAVSVSAPPDPPAHAAPLLRAQIAAPANGSFTLPSCNGVPFRAEVTRDSGRPPFTFTWTDVSTPRYPVLLAQTRSEAAPSPAAAPSLAPPADPAAAPTAAPPPPPPAPLYVSEALVNLTNGTHRVQLHVSDAAESLVTAEVVVTVVDSLAPAREDNRVARAGLARATEGLANVTAKVAGKERLLEAARARLAALQRDKLALARAAEEAESAAEKAAVEVGEMRGKVSAQQLVAADRRLEIAGLLAEAGPLDRQANDVNEQRLAVVEQLAGSKSGVAELEKLRAEVLLLQGKETGLQAGVANFEAQARASAAEAARVNAQLANVTRSAAESRALTRAQAADAKLRAKAALARSALQLQLLTDLQAKLQLVSDHVSSVRGEAQVLTDKLSALRSIANDLRHQRAEAKADAAAAANATAFAALDLRTAAAALGYAALPEGLFVPPPPASPGRADLIAANDEVSDAIAAAVATGVARSPLAAETGALAGAVKVLAKRADALRDRSYELELQEAGLRENVARLRDLAARGAYEAKRTRAAIAGQARRAVQLRREIVDEAAAVRGAAKAEAQLGAQVAAAVRATDAAAARAAALQARKLALERDVVRWGAYADDLEALAVAKGEASPSATPTPSASRAAMATAAAAARQGW